MEDITAFNKLGSEHRLLSSHRISASLHVVILGEIGSIKAGKFTELQVSENFRGEVGERTSSMFSYTEVQLLHTHSMVKITNLEEWEGCYLQTLKI